MILTVTLNPAVDLYLSVEELSVDDVNRVLWFRRDPGGKGINVSRVIHELGGKSIALSLLGGETGEEIFRHLHAKGIWVERIPVAGSTRTNIAIKEEKNGRLIKLNEKGALVARHHLKICLERLERLSHRGDLVALCGSLPPGAPPKTYSDFIRFLRARGIRVLLDADGESLREGLRALPSFIKPNVHELARVVGRNVRTLRERITAARKLLHPKMEGVLVSMGKEGAILMSHQGSWFSQTPKVKTESAIGSGDSLVGGFLLGLSRGKSFPESLRLGMACGTATAITPATELCHRKDVEKFLKKITIARLTEIKK